MTLHLNAIGQIALSVSDLERAEHFYGEILGLRKLNRFGDLVFFDCAGVRLLVEKARDPASVQQASIVYFRCADLMHAVATLKEQGVTLRAEPHKVAPMEDHDLWMAFFEDPDGHVLALMMEAPRGYSPTP